MHCLLSPTYTPFTNALFVPSYLYSLHQCIVCPAPPILTSPMHCLFHPTYTPFTNALFVPSYLYSLHQCIVCSSLLHQCISSLKHCLLSPTTPSIPSPISSTMHYLLSPTYNALAHQCIIFIALLSPVHYLPSPMHCFAQTHHLPSSMHCFAQLHHLPSPMHCFAQPHHLSLHQCIVMHSPTISLHIVSPSPFTNALAPSSMHYCFTISLHQCISSFIDAQPHNNPFTNAFTNAQHLHQCIALLSPTILPSPIHSPTFTNAQLLH